MMHLTSTFTALATLLLTVQAQDLFAPASTSGTLTGLKYTSVGATGTYNQVTAMPPGNFPTCDANPSCVTKPKQISGTSHSMMGHLFVACVDREDADMLCSFASSLLASAGAAAIINSDADAIGILHAQQTGGQCPHLRV